MEKNIQDSVLTVFTASPINVVVFKFHEMLSMGNGRNRALFTREKNSACIRNSRYHEDRAKNLRRPTPNDVLRVL